MKNSNKRGSLFTLLLSNYIIFTGLVVLIFIGAIYLAYWGNELNLPDLGQVNEYKDLLKQRKYDEFPTKRLLGKDGFIAVLDQDGKTIYNPGPVNIKLSKSDLEYITPASSNYYVDTKEIVGSEGKKNYQITISTSGSQDQTLILNDNFQLLYRSEDIPDTSMSEKKYLLLSNQFFEGYRVNRFNFLDIKGEKYNLLLFQKEDAAFKELKKIERIFSQSVLYFLIFYTILIIILILWLKKRINKPLDILYKTFDKYNIGQAIDQNYQGPKEFINIFENFSSMAGRLEESERQKRKLEEARRKMIADISHDFKTPIAVIQGYAKAITDGLIAADKQADYLSIIDRKASQLNQLILTFAEYSKMDHPDFNLEFKRMDICNYFRDFVAKEYSELELDGYKLDVKIPEKHIYCLIDSFHLNRAFSNILNNSIEHTKRGRSLYMELYERGDRVYIRFADEGDGISREIADKLFTPFVMADTHRHAKGSGLGLSIVKKIVDLHKGSLELIHDENSPWTTIFEISLKKL
ncbi:MAG: HAMP domain-containing sensor histidine kinase [Tissierellia bacterium]|nr:HAMP domain-containing sensor histidine kinase [Tissierellia bacterium]